jgi:hypothetical protein
MTEKKEEMVLLDEAKKAVAITCQRLALLHIAYARTIINAMGEKEGKKLILKAIKKYGRAIGEKVKTEVTEMGLDNLPVNYGAGKSRDLPPFGMHRGVEKVTVAGEERTRAFGCIMGETWKEMGESELGRLYCYVDPAKYMAFNPDFKLMHTRILPTGDECCEMTVRPTTKQERQDFQSEEGDWAYIDGDK